jgi:hypothetical protein
VAETDEDLPYVSAREWVDVVSRLRIPEGTGKKKVAARTVKGCAWRLAWWADGQDGTRVHPGTALIAVVCEVDYQTAKKVVAVLRGLGLLTLVRAARGPQGRRAVVADEYRLTLPENLLDRARVLSPTELRDEVQRVRDANAGKRVTGGTAARNSPADEMLPLQLRGEQSPATEGPEPGVAGEVSPPDPELRGELDPSCGGSSTPPSTSDHNTTAIDQTCGSDPAQPPTAPEPSADAHKATPRKCDHGLKAGKCVLCRRGLPSESVDELATVIPLRPPDRNAS